MTITLHVVQKLHPFTYDRVKSLLMIILLIILISVISQTGYLTKIQQYPEVQESVPPDSKLNQILSFFFNPWFACG